jgi:hypothetical protein
MSDALFLAVSDALFLAVSDALFPAVIVFFFTGCALLVRACERM